MVSFHNLNIITNYIQVLFALILFLCVNYISCQNVHYIQGFFYLFQKSRKKNCQIDLIIFIFICIQPQNVWKLGSSHMITFNIKGPIEITEMNHIFTVIANQFVISLFSHVHWIENKSYKFLCWNIFFVSLKAFLDHQYTLIFNLLQLMAVYLSISEWVSQPFYLHSGNGSLGWFCLFSQ